MKKKSLITSKTFWFNLLAVAVTLGDFIPSKYGLPLIAAGNIILRLMSSQAMTVFPTSTKKQPKE